MTNSPKPLVSVLMTAYNRQDFIAASIQSVLDSSYTDFEFIIVDDCSTDDTFSIANEFGSKDKRIAVFKNDKNMGDYPNRNIAASYAKGKYYKFVDSDDLISSDALEIMVNAMELNSDAAFGVSIRNSTAIKYCTPSESYYCHFFEKGLLDYGPSAVIINAVHFKNEKGFKNLRNVSDNDLWLRLAAKYPMLEINDGLIFWRQHQQQQIVLYPESYLEHHLEILMDNLNSIHCPLEQKEISSLVKKYRRLLAKSLLKFGLKSFRFKFVFLIWKKYHLNPIELF